MASGDRYRFDIISGSDLFILAQSNAPGSIKYLVDGILSTVGSHADLCTVRSKSVNATIDELAGLVRAGEADAISCADALLILANLLLLRMWVAEANLCRNFAGAVLDRDIADLLENQSPISEKKFYLLSAHLLEEMAEWSDEVIDRLAAKVPQVDQRLIRPFIRGSFLAKGAVGEYRQRSAVVAPGAGDTEFAEYLSGKSVAVVGTVMGEVDDIEEINSFDVVIRFNHTSAASQTGATRVDVSYFTDPVFHSLVLDRSESLSGLRFAVVQDIARSNTHRGFSSLVPTVRGAYRRSNTVFFKSHGNALQRLLFDIMRFDISRVKAFRMNMWMSPHDNGYKASRPNIEPRTFIHHDPLANFIFTKRLWEAGVLEADGVLEPVLQASSDEYISAIARQHGAACRSRQNALPDTPPSKIAAMSPVGAQKTFEWSKRHEEFFLDNKIYLRHVQKVRGVYQIGKKLTVKPGVQAERYATMPVGGFCTVGRHSYSASALPGEMKIGRFCSIASDVQVMGTQHPTARFTTSPLTYASRFEEIARQEYQSDFDRIEFEGKHLPPPVIGHDVWIGGGAVLKGGITIGHGAIVGAGAIVTKDVAPYAIVGGAPARVIRFRFSNEHIAELLELRWWNYRFIDLPPKETWEDMAAFLRCLRESIEEGRIVPEASNPIDLYRELPDL